MVLVGSPEVVVGIIVAVKVRSEGSQFHQGEFSDDA